MAGNSETETKLSDLQRSIQLLIKLKLLEIQGSKSQKEMILMLDGLDCTAGEISELLGVAKTTVAPIVSRAKGKKRAK